MARRTDSMEHYFIWINHLTYSAGRMLININKGRNSDTHRMIMRAGIECLRNIRPCLISPINDSFELMENGCEELCNSKYETVVNWLFIGIPYGKPSITKRIHFHMPLHNLAEAKVAIKEFISDGYFDELLEITKFNVDDIGEQKLLRLIYTLGVWELCCREDIYETLCILCAPRFTPDQNNVASESIA